MQSRSRSPSPAAGSAAAAVRQKQKGQPDESAWEKELFDPYTRAHSPSKDLCTESYFLKQTSGPSPAYFLSSQSIIFFDWDDTLYPTTEILDRWGLDYRETAEHLTPKQQKLVEDWASALCDYIMEACRLSRQVVIVTNSKTPWVKTSLACLAKYTPQLQELFASDIPGLKVVYAIDEVNQSLHAESFNTSPKHVGCAPSAEEEAERLTNAKYYVMNREVKAFYSQYPNQTWKNVLSLGDMHYEHDAIQEVTFNRTGPPKKKERIRTKAIVLPTEPSMSEITLRLRFSQRMLQAYVAFDGDLDLDLRAASDPFLEISRALSLPQLAEINFSRHAWGRECTPASEDDVPGMLAAVMKVVSTKMSL